MKTSQVLASLFFSGLAAAAPIAANKRDLVWKTEYVVVTEVVYTTVYDDDWEVPEATTTPAGSFYAVPEVSTSAEVKPTSTPSPTPTPTPAYTSLVETPSSIYTPPVVASSSIYTPPVVASSSIYTPPVVESSSIYTPSVVETPTSSATPTPTPEPVTSAAAEYVTSAVPASSVVVPVASSAVAAATSAVASPVTQKQTATSGEYSGDLTIYDNNGGFGACGTALYDTDMIVAIAQPAWGASTYDVMTGAATNKWCGQKIEINYNGKSVEATIMDMCPGCTGYDIDLSLAAWNALGMVEKTRIQGTWSTI